MSPKVISTADKLRMEQQKARKFKKVAVKMQQQPPKPSQQPPSATKKRKRPFRITVGTVVALRSRHDNTVALVEGEKVHQIEWDGFVCAWTKPMSGRDEGLALVGKMVRCVFSKAMAKSKRVLEGEVVSVEPYRSGKPILVEMLIDQSEVQHFDFLPVIDDSVDESLLSKKARRNHRLEERIRGKDKVTVRMKLVNPAILGAMGLKPKQGVTWWTQKLVPATLFHSPKQRSLKAEGAEKATLETINGDNGANGLHDYKQLGTNHNSEKSAANGENGTKGSTAKKCAKSTDVVRHVGDRNDPEKQQIANWRWLVTRYHDTVFSSQNYGSFSREILSAGFIGEVLKVNAPASPESSLAVVTLRKLVLPEHTLMGRSPYHTFCDIYDEDDSEGLTIQVPVEQLVVVGHMGERSNLKPACADSNLDHINLFLRYSLRNNVYRPLGDEKSPHHNETKDNYCHRCRHHVGSLDALTCSSQGCPLSGPGARGVTFWCGRCYVSISSPSSTASPMDDNMPCCLGLCDCRRCSLFVGSDLDEGFAATLAEAQDSPTKDESGEDNFVAAVALVRSIATTDFGLSSDFLDVTAASKPLAQPTTRRKARAPKRAAKMTVVLKSTTPKSRTYNQTKTPYKKGSDGESANAPGAANPPPMQVASQDPYFCARFLSYEAMRAQGKTEEAEVPTASLDRIRNMRQMAVGGGVEGERDEKKNSRSVRANQRRLLKDVVAIGSHFLGLDTLAISEPLLRFDRSGIHAWGVYADEDITAETRIIEYRGELIDNAVTEKREKQYFAAKIGSDYMFRIDSTLVCDATKQGNVARFINASCDPNCYTKIITVDGIKRIFIYAKRAIRSGEELCYDYKFPLEFDESKRIPCYCGAKECRGFMNWDKRYVVVPSTEKVYHSGSTTALVSSGVQNQVADQANGGSGILFGVAPKRHVDDLFGVGSPHSRSKRIKVCGDEDFVSLPEVGRVEGSAA